MASGIEAVAVYNTEVGGETEDARFRVSRLGEGGHRACKAQSVGGEDVRGCACGER